MRSASGVRRFPTGPGPNRPHPPAPPESERGQATVEFALVIPLVVMMMLTIVQVGLLVRDRVLVVHAAREAVREAAVGGGPAEVRAAAISAGPLAPDRLTVSLGSRGDRVEVTVHYDAPTEVPLVGHLLGDVGFDSAATMRLES